MEVTKNCGSQYVPLASHNKSYLMSLFESFWTRLLWLSTKRVLNKLSNDNKVSQNLKIWREDCVYFVHCFLHIFWAIFAQYLKISLADITVPFVVIPHIWLTLVNIKLWNSQIVEINIAFKGLKSVTCYLLKQGGVFSLKWQNIYILSKVFTFFNIMFKQILTIFSSDVVKISSFRFKILWIWCLLFQSW